MISSAQSAPALPFDQSIAMPSSIPDLTMNVHDKKIRLQPRKQTFLSMQRRAPSSPDGVDNVIAQPDLQHCGYSTPKPSILASRPSKRNVVSPPALAPTRSRRSKLNENCRPLPALPTLMFSEDAKPSLKPRFQRRSLLSRREIVAMSTEVSTISTDDETSPCALTESSAAVFLAPKTPSASN